MTGGGTTDQIGGEAIDTAKEILTGDERTAATRTADETLIATESADPEIHTTTVTVIVSASANPAIPRTGNLLHLPLPPPLLPQHPTNP